MRVANLRFGGLIDRYVGSLFLASYATALLLVVGLTVIMDIASHLDYFEEWDDGRRAPTHLIVRYYLLAAPFLFLQVAPFVTVVAALFTTTRIARSNEVVAALAAGISAHRVLLSVFGGAFLAAIGMFALREFATDKLGYQRDGLRDVLEHQRTVRIFDNLWLRDASSAFVQLDEFRPSIGEPPRAEIEGLRSLSLDEGVWTEQVADRATWVLGESGPRWKLEGGEMRRETETSDIVPIQYLQGVEFSPEDALLAWRERERPMELSFTEVLTLCARDPTNIQLQTLLQYHLTFPLANIVLLLVALPFVLSHRRSRGAEGLAAGLLMCVLYFCTDFLSRSLGMADLFLTPMVAAWLPVLLFGCLGAVFYEGMSS